MATVTVTKEYYLPGGRSEECIGTIEVEDVEQFRRDMDSRKVQSTDPRIEWDTEPDDDWVYVDFSFQIVEDDD